MFSHYFPLFNVQKNKFPYQKNLDLACQFSSEVVVAVNTSEDGTLGELQEFAKSRSNLKIIETNFSYNDIRFDGAIKNAALQATTQPVKIRCDADEYIPLSQKPKWEQYGKQLLSINHVKCLMVPSIDLYGSRENIRANSQVGLKFRMHKEGLRRGIMRDAWRGDHIDTSKSDTTELLDDNGEIPHSVRVAPMEFHNPVLVFGLADFIYTIHEGYLSFEHRVNVNKAIWAKAWRDRSGHEEDTPTEISQLTNVPVTKHGLVLE